MSRAARRAWIVLAVVAAPQGALALDPAKAVTQYLHEVWQTEQGLPQNTVQAIAEMPDGYLWLGTREGLARFDGVRFTVFDIRTTPELGHNFVLCLLADSKGLWIGTAGGGVVRLESGRFTRYADESGLPSEHVSALLEDRQGRLWVGTDGGGPGPPRGRSPHLVHDRPGTLAPQRLSARDWPKAGAALCCGAGWSSY